MPANNRAADHVKLFFFFFFKVFFISNIIVCVSRTIPEVATVVLCYWATPSACYFGCCLPRYRSALSTMDWLLDSEGQVELGWVKTHQVNARSYLEHPAWCFVCGRDICIDSCMC